MNQVPVEERLTAAQVLEAWNSFLPAKIQLEMSGVTSCKGSVLFSRLVCPQCCLPFRCCPLCSCICLSEVLAWGPSGQEQWWGCTTLNYQELQLALALIDEGLASLLGQLVSRSFRVFEIQSGPWPVAT